MQKGNIGVTTENIFPVIKRNILARMGIKRLRRYPEA